MAGADGQEYPVAGRNAGADCPRASPAPASTAPSEPRIPFLIVPFLTSRIVLHVIPAGTGAPGASTGRRGRAPLLSSSDVRPAVLAGPGRGSPGRPGGVRNPCRVAGDCARAGRGGCSGPPGGAGG